MNPDNNVKNSTIEPPDQFVPYIPKNSLLRPLSGRIYSKILTKTEDQNLSLFKKITLKVNLIWCVLLIPLDMAWNIILIPITFVCIPIKYTFGMIPGKQHPIGHNLPGVKKLFEEIKLVFVCIIEIGILPISALVPARWVALAHHKLMGYGYKIISTPPNFNKDSKSSTPTSSNPVSRNNSEIATQMESSPQKIRSQEPKCRPLIGSESLSDSQLLEFAHLDNSTVVSGYLTPKNSSTPATLSRSLSSSVTSLSCSISSLDDSIISPNASIVIPTQPTYHSPNDGTGPYAAGKVYNVGATVVNLALGVFTSPTTNPSETKLNNTGKQLDGYTVQCYLKGLKEAVGHNKMLVVDAFYVGEASSIGNCNLQSLTEQLKFYKKVVKPGQAIVIPLVIPGTLPLERNHIVTVLIKDNRLEYYDSKGIFSEHVLLPNGLRLNQMLKAIKNIFLSAKYRKLGNWENPTSHQGDANNCGAFVCKFIHDRLKLNRTFEEICKTQVSDIKKFRKEMLPLVQVGKQID